MTQKHKEGGNHDGYDRKPKILSELEKLMGKAEFAEKIGCFVVKPLGKPTLARATGKHEVYNPAAADFAGRGWRNNGPHIMMFH